MSHVMPTRVAFTPAAGRQQGPADRQQKAIKRSGSLLCSAGSKQQAAVQIFPTDYTEAIKQAQEATRRALADGCKLVEIDFPTAGLRSVPGDAEGANEMTYSAQFLRQFLRAFQPQAAATRVFFPDKKELQVAKEGKGMDPAAGSWVIDPIFDQTRFALDYLTEPTIVMDWGIDIHKGKINIASKVKPGDELIVAAYPHFNPGEMVAVSEIYQGAALQREIPIIVFNGELDRIRSGYYPPLFYPKMGRLAKDFIPLFEQAIYIHNFKGAGGGTLFRTYPGDWQVLKWDASSPRVVHSQKEMPSLKEVALEILPRAR